MSGLSPEALFPPSAAVLALTIALVIWLESRSWARAGEPVRARMDLLRYRVIAAVLHWRPFPFVARAPFVLIFLLIIFAGFLGSQTMGSNIAPVLTWTIWWALLIIVIPFLGKTWCLVCPW